MQLRKQWNPDGYLLYAGDDSLNGGGAGSFERFVCKCTFRTVQTQQS